LKFGGKNSELRVITNAIMRKNGRIASYKRTIARNYIRIERYKLNAVARKNGRIAKINVRLRKIMSELRVNCEK